MAVATLDSKSGRHVALQDMLKTGMLGGQSFIPPTACCLKSRRSANRPVHCSPLAISNALHAKFAQVMILVTHMHAYMYKAAQQYEQTVEKHTLFTDIGAQDSDPKQLFCVIPIELTIENLSFHHQFHSDFTW